MTDRCFRLPRAIALALWCSSSAPWPAWPRAARARCGRPAPDPAAISGDLNRPQGTNAGIFAFTGACASCHDSGRDGAPDRYTLARRTPEEVLAKIATGPHAAHATAMTEYQKRVVAVYVGGRPLGAAATGDKATMANACAHRAGVRAVHADRSGTAGASTDPTRASSPIPAASPRPTAPKLALKWAFGFPSGNSAYGQPSVVGGRVFVGATPASSTRSTPPPAASTGRSAPAPASAPRRPSAPATARTASSPTSATSRAASTPWTPRPAPKCGRRASTPIRWRASPARRSWPPAGCSCRCRRSRNRAPATRRIRAARSAAAWPPTTPRPARGCGRTSPSPTSRGAPSAPPSAPSCGRRPAPACGRRRRSTSSGAPSISPPATATPQPADIASDAVIAYDLDTGKRLWVKQVMANDSYVRDCPGIYRPNVPDGQQVRDLSRRSRTRHGLRQLADPARPARRQDDDRHRPEGRPRLGPRSRQAGRGDVEPAARPRAGRTAAAG